jgi:hypothetical protein
MNTLSIESNSSSETQGELYGQVRDDLNISDGAFRLWHVLRGMAGNKGYCWPGQRWLAQQYHWSNRSLPRWIEQLATRGYLRVETFEKGKFPGIDPRHRGVVYVPAASVGQTSHGELATAGQTAPPLYDKSHTVTVCHLSHLINSNKLIKENQVNGPDRPSLKEIEINFLEANSSAQEAEKFRDYYDGKGWMLGGSKIKSWPRLAAAWRRNQKKWDGEKNGSTPADSCQVVKCESDKDYYRVESNGVLYEFDRNTPPNGNHRLAWRNHFRGYVREEPEANPQSNPAAKHKTSASQGPKKVIQKKL